MLSASASVRVSAQQTQAQPEAPEVHEHVDVAGTLLTPTTDFSGTAWLPKATPMLGLHRSWREWDLRLDGTMFVQFLYEPGDRHRTGAAANHQLVSPNWVMAMARRRVGTGRFGLRTMRALVAGARAYLLKNSTDEDLIPAVRAVAAGKSFFSPGVAAVLAEDYVRQLQHRGMTDSYDLLTDREKEVLHLLAEGRSNKEVATLLGLGLSTIETHRANLMQKLNLHSTAEIVLYAVRKGLKV